MVEEGHRLVDIAKVLGRSKSTISMLLKRFRNRGSTENMPRSGRPNIVGDRRLGKLSRLVKLDRREPLRGIAAAYNSSAFEKCSWNSAEEFTFVRRSVR